MELDAKKIEEIIKKVSSDKKFMEKLEKNPAKALEEILGVDLPDAQVNAIVKALKAKGLGDELTGMLGGLLGK